MVEHTDDPHPRNALWEMWGDAALRPRPIDDVDIAMADVLAARAANPSSYVKVVCYDRSLGRQTTALSFIVGRPAHETRFRLERQRVAATGASATR